MLNEVNDFCSFYIVRNDKPHFWHLMENLKIDSDNL